MGELALSAVREGVESFAKLDREMADRVVAGDRRIDAMSVKIEAACLHAIALHQPVAADLRKLGAYYKAINDLRRIGRYGYDIALLTQRMEGLKHFKKLITIPEMSRLTLRMTQNALKALLAEDLEPIPSLEEDDELVDGRMEEIFREVLTYVIEDPRRVTVAMYYILAARYLERAADHAVAMGWHAHYMITGQRLHRPPQPVGK